MTAHLLAVLLAGLAGALWPRGHGLGRRTGPGWSLRRTGPALLRRWQPARRRAAAAGVAARLVEDLAAELRTGVPARTALATVAADEPLLAAVAAVARSPGGDVPAALRGLAHDSGADPAADLAAAWAVCETTGAGLAGPVRRLADGLRDVAQVRREVDAQLAAPTATAWLLAGLPVVGVAMGASLGADPVPLLLGTPWGRILLVSGLLLELLGLLWVRQIVCAARL